MSRIFIGLGIPEVPKQPQQSGRTAPPSRPPPPSVKSTSASPSPSPRRVVPRAGVISMPAKPALPNLPPPNMPPPDLPQDESSGIYEEIIDDYIAPEPLEPPPPPPRPEPSSNIPPLTPSRVPPPVPARSAPPPPLPARPRQ